MPQEVILMRETDIWRLGWIDDDVLITSAVMLFRQLAWRMYKNKLKLVLPIEAAWTATGNWIQAFGAHPLEALMRGLMLGPPTSSQLIIELPETPLGETLIKYLQPLGQDHVGAQARELLGRYSASWKVLLHFAGFSGPTAALLTSAIVLPVVQRVLPRALQI